MKNKISTKLKNQILKEINLEIMKLLKNNNYEHRN